MPVALRWLIISAWVSALLMGGSAANDPLQQPVTFDQPAQSVRQLLQVLSRQTGVKLFASSPLDNEIVLVLVQQMPLKELMDYLAQVMDGEWMKQADGSYRLVRTPRAIQRRRAEDEALLLRGLQRALERQKLSQLAEPLTQQKTVQLRDNLKQLMREIESQELPGDVYTQPQYRALREQIDSLTGLQRVWARLLLQLDLRQLLKIPVGERRVFSNMPGRYLTPFGFATQPLLEQYRRECQLVQDVWTHPTEGFNRDQIEQFYNRYRAILLEILDRLTRAHPTDRQPTRIYLEVRRSTPASWSFKVELTDESQRTFPGWSLAHLQVSLEDLGINERFAPSPGEPVVRVEWSEPSHRYLEAYRTLMRTREPTPLPAIVDPAQTEPLSLIPTDILRTFARQKGKPLVVRLSDELGDWFRMAIQARTELHRFLEVAQDVMQLSETERVLLYKPRWSSYTPQPIADRQLLSEQIHKVLQQGYFRLENWLALSTLELNRFRWGGVPALLLDLIVSSEDWTALMTGNFQFVRALTPEQLAQLQAGKTLIVADLKPPQRALLNHEIYEVGILINLEHEGATRAGPSERLCQLPHAFYPDGLPPDTTLKLVPGDSSLGLFTERKLGVWGVCRSLDNIASELQIVESFQSEESDAALPEYAQGIKARYAQALMPARFQLFTLEVRPVARRRIDLPMERWRGFGDHEPLTNTSAAPLDKLPADFRQKLEEAKRRLKERGEIDD